MKKRLLFINNMAAPYQVKFCYALQEYYDAEMWFYTHLENNRPKWWAIPMGNKCKVLEGSHYYPILNYSNPKLLNEVKKFKPDIIIAGGFFFPSQYFVKKWAIKNKIKYIALGERISFENFKGVRFLIKKFIKKLSVYLYRDIDLFLAMGERPMKQMIEDFGFPQNKIIIARYPQDIDENLKHDLRTTKNNPVLIFPNRLDRRYNPLFALEVFNEFNKIFPQSSLRMNAMGELKNECQQFIFNNGLVKKVSFLDNIKTWDELPQIYQQADIAIFTAIDSNGPNSLIECMASGTGVVLSNKIHNVEEYAKHNENCFIADLKTKEYVEYLTKYVTIDGLIRKHGALSKKKVANRSVKETAKFYFKIIEEKLF